MRSMNTCAPTVRGWNSASDHELLTAAQEGHQRALDEVVRRFRPLVLGVARRLHGRGGSEELDDLIQVGMLGLLEAASRFEPGRGRFAPYAKATVSGTIKRHYRDRSWKFRVPRSLHDAAALIRARSPELEGRLGRVPTATELAAATGLSEGRVREAQQLLANAQPKSLQAAAGEGGGELGELLGCDDAELEQAELRGMIASLGAELDPADRELLARRFGLEQTQSEIAERIGGSQMRISRRLSRVLESMAARATVGELTET